MVETASEVAELVHRELASIRDAVVRDALFAVLVAPTRHLREWDYGKPHESYPCWTIAQDASSDLGLVYSDHGHGPSSPWGLVSLSHLWFGMDSGWFARLEDAFVDSSLAAELEIWNVVAPDRTVVHSSSTLADAFARRDALDAGHARPRHHVVYRSRMPNGVP